MAGQTRLTQSQLNQLSQQHIETKESVNSQQQNLAASISALLGANKGEMMMALQRTHDAWDAQCKSITQNLQGMAEAVKQASQMTGQRDEESGQAVGKIEVPGMASHLG